MSEHGRYGGKAEILTEKTNTMDRFPFRSITDESWNVVPARRCVHLELSVIGISPQYPTISEGDPGAASRASCSASASGGPKGGIAPCADVEAAS